MEYISVGAVLKPSTEHIVNVSRCGQEFQLTGMEAEVWLEGRFGFAKTEHPLKERALRHLERMGLVVLVTASEHGRYWALTGCVICPASKKFLFAGLNPQEKTVLKWITGAGLRLSVAELVYLMGHAVMPVSSLLGEENRQAFVEAIYTRESIFDNLLENEMSHETACDETICLVLQLLKKKKLVLI